MSEKGIDRKKEITIDYYEENAEKYTASTVGADMSAVYEKFEAFLNPGARILDLGSGSGRDSLHFVKKGYSVVAADASQAMCEETKKTVLSGISGTSGISGISGTPCMPSVSGASCIPGSSGISGDAVADACCNSGISGTLGQEEMVQEQSQSHSQTHGHEQSHGHSQTHGHEQSQEQTPREHGKLQNEFHVLTMKAEDLDLREEFDAVWACASLLHVREHDMPEVIRRISAALRPGSIAYMSWKYGSGERQEGSRHFTDYTEERFRDLMSVVPSMEILDIWITGDTLAGRDSLRWLNAIVKRL